ncbi:C-X-C chemokine receptor type 3-2, partial [Silurus meridionalis]
NFAPCNLTAAWYFTEQYVPATYILVFILAILGNMLVLIVIRRYRQSHRSPCAYSLTDTFLLHLAISDLLLALTLPFFAAQWITGWVFTTGICKLAGALFSLNVYCGVLFLACISFDRYLAIVHAVHTNWRHNTCLAQLACAIIWICCIGLSAIDINFRKVVDINGFDKQMCTVDFNTDSSAQWQLSMQLVSLLLGFCLPLLVMLYCYLRIFHALCQKSTRRQKRRSLRLIISLVAVFVLCWAPCNILKMVDSLRILSIVSPSCTMHYMLDVSILVTESLGLAHTALNPLLYGFVGVKFRRELYQMFKTGLSSARCQRMSQGMSRRPTGSFSSVDKDCIRTRTIVATFFSVLYSVALLLGLLGNVLMLVVLWQKRCSWSVTDAFVLHMSVADLLLLLTVPLWAVDAVRGWSFGSGVCKLTGVLFKINFYCCIFLLTCISLHLYCSINHTRQMGLCRKPRLVHLLCLAVWIFCLILSIPDWMYLKAASNSNRENDIECVYEYPSRASRVASCLCFHVLGFWIPAIVLLSCYTCVLEQCRSDQYVQKRRVVYIILVLCVVFFLSWTPYNIALVVDTFQDLPSKSTESCDNHRWTALKITHAVGVLHSCFNPLIYLGLSEKFRR